MRREFWRYNAHLVAAYLGAFVLLTVAVSQCGCTVDSAIKNASVAAVPLSGLIGEGYKAANLYDAEKVTSIRDRKNAGDDAGALAEWQDYLPKIQKVQQVLDAGADIVSALLKTIEAVKLGLAQPADLYAYLPKLASAAADIRSALKTIGVNIP